MLIQNMAPKELQHELRTPLTTILGMIRYLKSEPLSSAQEDCVDGILQSANQLLKFANTLQPQPHNDIPTKLPKKPRVLLVEDHPLIRQIHQSLLSDLNYQTDVAENAKEALALAVQDYDLIILDIGLPDLSGIELAKRLKNKANHQNTRLLALTAYTDLQTEQSCLEAGIEQVLHKPVDPNTLAAVLCSHQPFKEGSR